MGNFEVDNELGSGYRIPWCYREKINLERLGKDVEKVNRENFEKRKRREMKVRFGKIVKSFEAGERAGEGLENALQKQLALGDAEVQANKSILGEFEKLETEKKMLSLSKSKKKRPIRSSIENSTPKLRRSQSKPNETPLKTKQSDSDIQSDLLLQLNAAPRPEKSLFDEWLSNPNPIKHLRMNSCNVSTQPPTPYLRPQERSHLVSRDKTPKGCELSSTGLGLTESGKHGLCPYGQGSYFANSEFRKKLMKSTFLGVT